MCSSSPYLFPFSPVHTLSHFHSHCCIHIIQPHSHSHRYPSATSKEDSFANQIIIELVAPQNPFTTSTQADNKPIPLSSGSSLIIRDNRYVKCQMRKQTNKQFVKPSPSTSSGLLSDTTRPQQHTRCN